MKRTLTADAIGIPRGWTIVSLALLCWGALIALMSLAFWLRFDAPIWSVLQ
jgi:hypothetical protein